MTSELRPEVFSPLRRGRFGEPYLYVPECRSTQELLRDDSLPEGAVAVAEHQTAGRGRLGRTWEDISGDSLLCSLLLRPPGGVLPQLSLVAALATAAAIEAVTGTETQFKWPNDVLLGGRKVAGILLEATGGAVVVGFGINVKQRQDELPRETRTPAGSLLTAGCGHHDRGLLLAELLKRFEQAYDRWNANGIAEIATLLGARDALSGRHVRIAGLEGVAAGVTPSGGLELELPSGDLTVVESGEVEIIRSINVGE